MGALAPVTLWIPEDDLLLKNAVEAGASLESLAKGAVCFSRRFTIQELQDRWHSLLYDSDVSAEASAHILEIELSVSNLPQSNKSCISKGKEWIPRKRKVDSVRNHYYAMRKRICNEPCNSVDLDFLMPPNAHVCTANDGSCQEELKLNTGHSVGNCMLGTHISNGFALHEAGFDIVHHAFPQMAMVDTAVATDVDVTANTFHNGHVDSLVHDLPNCGAIAREILYGFAENVTPVIVDKSVGKNIDGHSFEHDNLHKGVTEILGENLIVFQSCPGVQEMEQRQTLPSRNLFETDDLEVKPLSTFGSMNNNQVNVCSGFGENQNFSSPVSDCGASFHQLGYSSPLCSIPIWGTIEDISAPVMQIEANLEDKDHCVRATLVLSAVDDKKMEDYDVHSESKLNDGISGDGLNGSTVISEGDLIELSNSLLNFVNEEELLDMDVDDKDSIDRSCLDGLNSIFLSSPNDVHQDDIPNSCDPKTSAVSDTCLVIPDGACPGELDDIGDPLDTSHGEGQHNTCGLELNIPATSSKSYHCAKSEELMCCTLNTEDPEIPCNDDIFSPTGMLPPFVSSALQNQSMEATSSFPPSNKEFCDKENASEREPALKEEVQEATSQSPVTSLTIEPSPLPEVYSKHPTDGHGVKTELSENDSSARRAGMAGEDPSICAVVPVTTHCVSAIKLNEQIMIVEPVKRDKFNFCIDSLLERSVQGDDHTKSLAQNVADGCKLEMDGLITLQKHEELGSGEMGFPELVTNFSTLDHEELLHESDDDVPYFSDIEAMILDMDLGPYDQESHFTREASRYQYEDTKKAIVRLEQGAHSYMQRAIASHGAFAVFYGRRLKHYIKKTEVSLGRATEDVNVDIDLGREGRANKISRQQAIIKMEEDGSFYLKNLGKCSVSVNSKEIATGQRLNLTSSCLIEIRGMRFMFEMNQGFVSKCTTDVAKRKSTQEKTMKFEFVPSEIP